MQRKKVNVPKCKTRYSSGIPRVICSLKYFLINEFYPESKIYYCILFLAVLIFVAHFLSSFIELHAQLQFHVSQPALWESAKQPDGQKGTGGIIDVSFLMPKSGMVKKKLISLFPLSLPGAKEYKNSGK